MNGLSKQSLNMPTCPECPENNAEGRVLVGSNYYCYAHMNNALQKIRNSFP